MLGLGRARLRPRWTRQLHAARFRPKIMETQNDRRPADWKAQAPPPPQGAVTFAHQERLPRLPVLPLQPTLDNLKRSLRPLAWTEDEYAAAVRKIDEFGAPGGVGEQLQARLEARAADREHWLEEWWDDMGYLKYRDSVVVNVSYYYGFTPHPEHLSQTPAHRAAALTRATLLFRAKLKQGLLEPDATKEGPICMDTWRWMFDCCRIPGQAGADWSYSHARPDQTGIDGHVVVFRRNSVWKIEAAAEGRLLTTDELEKIYNHIYALAAKRDWPEVGILTASNRDVWAKDYARLKNNYSNNALIRDIQSAAFVVCLDEDKPEGPIDFSRALWHGGKDGKGLENRWVDKPVQFVVYDNCKAGVMGEHSVMDGTPMVRLCDDVLTALHRPDFDHGDAPPLPLQQLVSAKHVTNPRWVVDTDMVERISKAKVAAAALTSEQTLGFHLTKYGKQEIKTYGASPDGWAQMIVQLAYARLLRAHPELQGKGEPAPAGEPVRLPGGTYEAAMTRRFFKGRTEAIRVVSDENRAWVASMDDAAAPAEKRRELFAAALKRHGADAREAGAGRGVDRHLFGLRMSAQPDDGRVPLFDDTLFQRSSTWVLSTSAIFSAHFPVYGWGEVVPNGFGVAYMTGYDDRLQFTITSRVEMPNAAFVQEIERAAEDVRALFSAIDGGKSKL
ncbi:acyltransferase ChoActase/COT/CPT [Auricularia subglabra TFB-10046 SS5]|nr:acyltransferase ChoActase/COT/CPT [Auricularia subglabra TFB-10046 SS5]